MIVIYMNPIHILSSSCSQILYFFFLLIKSFIDNKLLASFLFHLLFIYFKIVIIFPGGMIVKPLFKNLQLQ